MNRPPGIFCTNEDMYVAGAMPQPTLELAVFDTENTSLVPVLADLKRIALMPEEEGALRNLFITQRYHDISQSMTGPLGTKNVNWCTFAAWASKTAGESIRGEELPAFAERLLEREGFIERIIGAVKSFFGITAGDGEINFFDDVREILAGVTSEIAGGNLKVYAEIAPLFSRFVVELGSDTALSEENWNSYVRIMRDGPPEADGQDLLKKAFREYYEALFETDEHLIAQKFLRANALVGLHEQTRLQSAIKGAMDVPAEEGLQDLLRVKARLRFPDLSETELGERLREHHPVLKRLLIEGWERIATRVAMRLALPGGESVDLSDDVPKVDGRMFPADLTEIDYAPLNELILE